MQRFTVGCLVRIVYYVWYSVDDWYSLHKEMMPQCITTMLNHCRHCQAQLLPNNAPWQQTQIMLSWHAHLRVQKQCTHRPFVSDTSCNNYKQGACMFQPILSFEPWPLYHQLWQSPFQDKGLSYTPPVNPLLCQLRQHYPRKLPNHICPLYFLPLTAMLASSWNLFHWHNRPLVCALRITCLAHVHFLNLGWSLLPGLLCSRFLAEPEVWYEF